MGCIKNAEDASPLSICAVFQEDRSRMFTQKVDDSRVTIATSQVNVAASADSDRARAVIVKAIHDATCLDSIIIYDFVDHLTDGREVDWIENTLVNKLILEIAGKDDSMEMCK